MPTQNRLASGKRVHIVLVPGFGGFDALGKVEYYAGITPLFGDWRGTNPVVLHYFDNLPTAAVRTRATRLRRYLATRIARGEILETDKIVLVGHSTGGLDIRQLICDLANLGDDSCYVDGGSSVLGTTIRRCLDGVVFLSVPQRGTNIADWVHSHTLLRTAVIADLRAAVAGSQVYLLDRIETEIAGGTAFFTDADLLLALRDALAEANEHYGEPGPLRTADALEAASELELYVRQMCSDFRVINDLKSQPYDSRKKSPAHFDKDDRKKELDLWDYDPPIRALSFVTVGGRPFRFPSRRPAPVWELTNPCTYPEIARDLHLSGNTDFLYRLCYRACAGGPLKWPQQGLKVTRVLGQAPQEPIELWDNDGIVNTVSMFWPKGETVLVVADHLDVVGHFRLVEAARDKDAPAAPRTYQSYNSFKSVSHFERKTFHDLWTEIFDFAANPKTFAQRRKSKPKVVKLAVPTAARA